MIYHIYGSYFPLYVSCCKSVSIPPGFYCCFSQTWLNEISWDLLKLILFIWYVKNISIFCLGEKWERTSGKGDFFVGLKWILLSIVLFLVSKQKWCLYYFKRLTSPFDLYHWMSFECHRSKVSGLGHKFLV